MRTLGLLVSIGLLAGCSGSYSDLEAAFAKEPNDAPVVADDFQVAIQKRERTERFAHWASVRTSTGRIDLSPSLYWRRSVPIPATEVAYCSMACFQTADSHVDLLVPRTGSLISIRNKQELLDWCRAHRIPLLSASDKRNWLDNGAPLPPPSSQAPPFDDRSAFEKQAYQGCAG
ncbi:hypothetical protein [Tahibacter sp.]|uniref:hypothetical protein n=1 Tax=Tahibacter sp. TaxID=2056211 RepID=UPI0028C4C0AF|nr:hypothetical protein [Tahibacter sp.]